MNSKCNTETCSDDPIDSKISILTSKHKQMVKLRTTAFTCDSSPPELYNCKYCLFQNHLRVVLNDHVTYVHRQTKVHNSEDSFKRLFCRKCDFHTYSVLILTRHYGKCGPGKFAKWFECDQSSCGNEQNSSMDIHTLSNQNDDIKRFKCDKCSYKTKKKFDLKNHLIVCHTSDNEIKWYKCNHCDYRAKVKNNLNKHTRGRHANDKNIKEYECDQCTFKSKWSNHLQRHKLLKHSIPNTIPWLHCDQCTYRTKEKKCLQSHAVFKHTSPEDIKWFKCEHCNFRAKQKYSLKKHSRLMHTLSNDIKWFKCEVCDFKTRWKQSLKKHSLSKCIPSDQIRWFKCNQCLFRTEEESLLDFHIQSSHTILKNDNCFNKSESKSSLKKHFSSCTVYDSESESDGLLKNFTSTNQVKRDEESFRSNQKSLLRSLLENT